MKTDTLVLIAAAGLGLFFISRVAKGMGGTSPTSTGAARATAAPDGVNLFAGTEAANMTPLQDAYNTSGYYTAEVYNGLGYMGTTK